MHSNWRTTTLGETLPFSYGKNLPAKTRSHTGEFDVVTSAGVVDSHNEAYVHVPSIVIGRKGTIGSLTYCPNPVWPTDTTFFATETDACDLRFGYYLLHTLHLRELNNDSAVPGLNRSDAHALEIHLPPRSEQVGIAKVLGALDDKIAANNRAKGIALDLIKTLGGKPTNTVKLSVLCERSTRSIKPEAIEAKTVLHYSLPAFDLGAAAQEDPATIKSNKFSLERPCVLLSKLNPHTPRIWSVPVINEDVPMIASSEFVVLQPTTCRQAQLFAATAQPELFHHLESLTGGTSKSHQRVRPADILTSEVPDTRTLSAEESQMLELLTLRFESLVVENQTLASTRDELLPLLMSGRITVGEAEDAADVAGTAASES